ncbi:MAG: succinate dehydrogenase, cytochrome b556 subunit [Rhodospirillaceae bacterium]|nr:succinate dehydrogenase, cytochrome b556 subunit [Rhodospirillaceae bacterium]
MTHAAKSPARPLSPHLQVYRLPLAAWLSISHRAAGIGLTLGTLLLTWWLAAAAYGPDAYALFSDFISSALGLLILFGFSVALFFHLCNGIRHLLWDAGKNFSIETTKRTNIYVIAGTVVLTAIAWLIAYL